MAVFYKRNRISPGFPFPFMINLSSLEANCVITQEILDKCNEKVREIIKSPSFSIAIVTFYLQVSILTDQDIKFINAVDVYEPIIELFEKEGYFVYRERGMSFFNAGLISLNNWFDRFSEF